MMLCRFQKQTLLVRRYINTHLFIPLLIFITATLLRHTTSVLVKRTHFGLVLVV